MIGAVAACMFLVSLLLVRNQTAIHYPRRCLCVADVRSASFTWQGFHYPTPSSMPGPFELVAWFWARDGRWFDDFTTGSYLYSWLSSGVYLIFGRVPFLLHVINSYFGTLTIYFVMRSAQLLSPDTNLDRAVGWTLAFYPSAVLYSVLTMREAPIVLAMSISIHLLLSWVSTRRIAFGLGAISFVIVAQLFHAGMIGATLAVLLIYASRVSSIGHHS